MLRYLLISALASATAIGCAADAPGRTGSSGTSGTGASTSDTGFGGFLDGSDPGQTDGSGAASGGNAEGSATSTSGEATGGTPSGDATTGGATTGGAATTGGDSTTGGTATGGTTGGGTTSGGGTTGGGTTSGGATTGGDTTSGGGTTGGGTTGGTTGGSSGGDVAALCASAGDCDGDICLPVGDGYCSVSDCATVGCPTGTTCYEFTDVGTFCLRDCSSASDCEAGQICDSTNACWPAQDPNTDPPTGDGAIGGACDSDADCADPGAICYPYLFEGEPTGFVNGYCIIFECTPTSCPTGSVCETVTADGGTACVAGCQTASDCRSTEGYTCYQPGVCFPGCGSSSTCPANYACDAEQNACMPACTPGSCTGGLVCDQTTGQCDDPPCTAGSCGAGMLCAASGDCVPDLADGPGPGPGPACNNLPPKACTGSSCTTLSQFLPVEGPGYVNYPLNGETWDNQYRSFARQDMQVLIKWAAAYVDCKAAGWGGGNGHPLGLGDMSEADGAIPGTSVGSPGHPAGTHLQGADMDIAYYTNAGTNNYLKPVCDHVVGGQDQYHCTSEPYLLDVWRTALFLGALMSSERTRVIGVDGKIGPLAEEAIGILQAQGWLPPKDPGAQAGLAYETTNTGQGWYNFHHHHLHISLWSFSGKPGAQIGPQCLVKDCTPVDTAAHAAMHGHGHGHGEHPMITLPVQLSPVE